MTVYRLEQPPFVSDDYSMQVQGGEATYPPRMNQIDPPSHYEAGHHRGGKRCDSIEPGQHVNRLL